MNCIETQRCIHLFLKNELDEKTQKDFVKHVHCCNECMEELTIEYLLFEGIKRLENADDFDIKKELDEKLNITNKHKKSYARLKAGLFLVASMFVCIFFL